MSQTDLHKQLDFDGITLPQHQRALKQRLLRQYTTQQSIAPSFVSAFANIFKGTITMKNITFAKPVIIIGGLIATTILGGTSYAILSGWPGVSTLFGGQTNLDNGNRIVKVSAQNCVPEYMNMDPTLSHNTKDFYYEVNHPSKLTNEQIEQLVRGKCEFSQQLQQEMTVGRTALQENPANRDKLIIGGYVDSVVKSNDRSGLTIESAVPMGDPSQPGGHISTFTQHWPHVDPNVVVYYGTQRISLGDIKPGDHISIKYRADGRGQNSESTPPNKLQTDLYTVVYITKNLPNISASIDYDKYYGRDFAQVFPCSEQADGFCTLMERHKQ